MELVQENAQEKLTIVRGWQLALREAVVGKKDELTSHNQRYRPTPAPPLGVRPLLEDVLFEGSPLLI